MKICINNPIWLNKKSEKNYLGARYSFVLNNADGLYFNSKINFLKWFARADNFTRLEVLKNKEIHFDTSEVNRKYDSFVTLNNPSYREENFIDSVKIMKINALYDYNFNVIDLKNSLVNSKVDYLIGHARHDLYDPFFKSYLSEYTNRVIDFPLGYNSTLGETPGNKNKKILGLGAVTPLQSHENNSELKEYYNYFFNLKGRKYSHQERFWFRENKILLSEIFDSFYPEPPVKRDFKNNEQKLLAKYKFFVNDLGSLTFLPARMFEGIALGCIPFAHRHPIYEYYGFDENNMVMFDSLDPKIVENAFFSALENFDQLQKNVEDIQHKYTFEAVSANLYKNIEKCYKG